MIARLRGTALTFLLLLSISWGVVASADSDPAVREYQIFGPGRNRSRASNGDVIDLSGQGTLSIHPKTVTGLGTFVHTNQAGNLVASGTWIAEELLRFHSYGPGTPGPEGGLALIRVHLVPLAKDAILQIDCIMGSPPAGAVEGIRLAIQDGGPNFNKEINGATLYTRLP